MTTQTPVDIGTLIVPDPDPDSIRGWPVLAGSRVPVHAVAACFLDGESPEEILHSYPQLDLSRVHAALAYYFANRERIEADLREDYEWNVRMARRFPNGWTTEQVSDEELGL